MFSIEAREAWIKQLFKDNAKVKIVVYSGLTVNFCQEQGAQYIVRGLRTSADFEFERRIAQLNKSLQPNIETLFIGTAPELSYVSSSGVRDILKNGGDVSGLVPTGITI